MSSCRPSRLPQRLLPAEQQERAFGSWGTMGTSDRGSLTACHLRTLRIYEYANLVGTLILIFMRIRLVHGTHRAAAPEYILGCFWRLCELDTFIRLE